MKNQFVSLYSLFGVLTLFTSVLFIFLIYVIRQKESKQNGYFFLHLVCLGFVALFFLLYDLGLGKPAQHLLPWFNGVILLIGASLRKYLLALMQIKAYKWEQFIMLSGLIWLVSLVSYIGIIAFEGPIKETSVICFSNLTLFTLKYVFPILNALIIGLSFRSLIQHKKNVKSIFSYNENVSLPWVNYLLFAYTFLVFGLFIIHFIESNASDYAYNLLMVFYLVLSGYFVLGQPSIYADLAAYQEKSETIEDILNHATLQLDNEFVMEIKQKLMLEMEENKLFLQHDLSVYSLAKKLDTNSKYLSRVINDEFNESFISFINRFRVREAQTLLLSDDKEYLTIEALSNEAGFKSKSAFNQAFKKFTGVTPSVFKKEKGR